MDKLREELSALAKQCHGVILTEDLGRHGLDAVERATAVRLLHRLRRGAYALEAPKDVPSRHRLLLRAVLRQLGGSSTASHVSAALMHDLPTPDDFLDTVHVTVDSAGARTGVRNGVHTHLPPKPSHARAGTAIDGLAVTDVATTVLDCARMLPVVDAVAMLDSALNSQLVDRDTIVRGCAEAKGMPGISTARRIVELADAGAQSVGETRMRLILVQAGFKVDSQVVLRDSRGNFVARVDLKLRDARVVVEFDGRAKYSIGGVPEAVVWREKIRHDRIGNLGYERVRVWWNRLADPEGFIREVNEARDRDLRRAAPRR